MAILSLSLYVGNKTEYLSFAGMLKEPRPLQTGVVILLESQESQLKLTSSAASSMHAILVLQLVAQAYGGERSRTSRC